MGVSTNGILVFGFDLGVEDENPLPDLLGEDEDFDDFVADEAGVTAWREDMTEQEKDDRWASLKKAAEDCPVEMIMHCSCDYPMYILAVRGTEKISRRGDPTVIEPSELLVAEGKITAAKAWCEKYKVEWREPKWLLASLWC